ncbi:MAG: hypothetical protein JWR15_1702 [Prosthecobacter sp.]|nr:hypothetical protein [Prosthecobacter sp.]
MTLQHDLQADSSVFSALVEVEMTDTDRSKKGNWKSETRLSMLSHEITRYMPELAAMLAEGGKQRLMAA